MTESSTRIQAQGPHELSVVEDDMLELLRVHASPCGDQNYPETRVEGEQEWIPVTRSVR